MITAGNQSQIVSQKFLIQNKNQKFRSLIGSLGGQKIIYKNLANSLYFNPSITSKELTKKIL